LDWLARVKNQRELLSGSHPLPPQVWIKSLSIQQKIRSGISATGWRLPFREALASTQPVVLAYHGVPERDDRFTANDFENQVKFLKKHFEVIHWEQLDQVRSRGERIRVLLTFDDGFRNNAEFVAPILKKYRAPAVFFINSRHTQPGQYLWFSYLAMLLKFYPEKPIGFRGEQLEMSVAARNSSVARLRERLLKLTPHPSTMYQAIEQEFPHLEDFTNPEQRKQHCDGMTEEQISELASDSLFAIGVHTVDHPFLTKCDPTEAEKQIVDNRKHLEAVTGRRCDFIAYPVSDFSTPVLDMCARLGFSKGFSLEHRSEGPHHLQIPRVDIYYPSLDELGFKVRWGNLLASVQRQRKAFGANA
jgi:peptidoglycan/xylan/chitin deacetylase (PgdA/CDA1 family)